MHYRGVLLVGVILGLGCLAAPSSAEAQQSSAPVPGGLPINWALTPFGNDPRFMELAQRLPPRTATNQREHGLNQNQLRALSWLGPGPWFNPGTPSGIRGAAMVTDTATGKAYALYEDGRTQLIDDPTASKPF